MTVAAMMLLCVAVLVAWIGGQAMTVQTHMAWQYRNPADLHRPAMHRAHRHGCHVGRPVLLDLIRLSPVHAVLKYRGIGLHVIDCDLRHHTNKTSDGIRAVVITEGKP